MLNVQTSLMSIGFVDHQHISTFFIIVHAESSSVNKINLTFVKLIFQRFGVERDYFWRESSLPTSV